MIYWKGKNRWWSECYICRILAGIAFMAFKNSSISGISNNKGAVSQSQEKADLELVEHKTMNINYFNYVTGTIKNNTKKTFEYVQVQIDIYNNDMLTGTTMASTNNLKPGEKWNFSAPVLEQGVYKYKFASITGY